MRRSTLGAVKDDIDTLLGPEPEPEPEPEGWVYHSTYRGIEIQVYMPGSTNYLAYLNGGYASNLLSVVKAAIDAYLEPEPEPEPKKPTTLTVNVDPMSGVPPYGVIITVHLTSNGVAVVNKIIALYKNNKRINIGTTDSSGKIEFTNTVTDEASYFAYWVGDSEYEGCDTQPAAGFGGLGLLAMAYLIMEGGT